MDKHSINGTTALEIAAKILKRSSLGGAVEIWGSLVVASFQQGDASLTFSVTFQPSLAIEVQGEGKDTESLEHMLEVADKMSDTLRDTFDVFQVA